MIERRKGRTVWEIDARRFVTRFERAEGSLPQELSAYVDVSGAILLDLVASIRPEGSVKPREVLQAVFPGVNLGHRAIRVALLDSDGKPISDATTSRSKDQSVLEIGAA
jgi:hypothetical protein